MKRDNIKMNVENIIIIGAPRSGTNLLRNLLTAQDKFGSWPCDEINYIWRHHNINYCSDEFPKELARKSVKKYIKSGDIFSKYLLVFALNSNSIDLLLIFS